MWNTILSAAAVLTLTLASAPAEACDKSCSCAHGKKEGAAADAHDHGTAKKAAKDSKAVKPAPATKPAAAPDVTAPPAGPTEGPRAEKCSCSGPSDCTCKKNQCQCKKCGGRQHRLIEPINVPSEAMTLPSKKAQRHASGGLLL